MDLHVAHAAGWLWGKLRGKPTISASAEDSGRAVAASDARGATFNLGDVHHHAPEPPKVDWWKRDGAPSMQLHPAASIGELKATYDMTAHITPKPSELRVRWRGMGLDRSWRAPNWTNNGGTHIPTVTIALDADQDDSDLADGCIAVEAEFWFNGEECHLMQVFPAARGPVAPSDERYDVRRW
jgi:hypothetical protein